MGLISPIALLQHPKGPSTGFIFSSSYYRVVIIGIAMFGDSFMKMDIFRICAGWFVQLVSFL